jgi:RHS repeat-associated protein
MAGLGLYNYRARFYDPALGRFTQPDTIVPDQYNPQSLNRYSYVGNTPINGTDPDGHCYPLCTMAIGAAIGAMAGGIAYTIANHGQDFNYKGFAGAVGVGLVAGGVIGTGVGIGLLAAAPAAAGTIVTAASVAVPLADASMAISAGTAGLVTGGTYIASHPGNFESTDFYLQTGSSLIAGAASADPTAGILTKVGVNFVAADISYYMNGQDLRSHSWEGLAVTSAVAAATSLIPGGQLPVSRYIFPTPMAGSLATGTIGGFISGIASNGGSSLGDYYDRLYGQKK